MTATGIVLCLIVKDEEANLEGCVRSAAGVVDEVVVGDTGSTDGTVALAERLGARTARVPMNGDFSRARNAVLDLVDGRHEWVLFIDADERLLPAEAAKLPGVVASAGDALGLRFVRYNFFGNGGWYSGRNLKLFRLLPEIRYERMINESLSASIRRAGGVVADAAVTLNHFGHCRPRASRDAKAHRYMALMSRQLERDPGDAVLLAYLGLLARTLGDFGEARTYSDRAVAAGDDLAVVWAFRGHVLRSLDEVAAARAAYGRAVDLDAADAASWNMIGVCDLGGGDLDAAGAAFTRAAKLDPLLVHVDVNRGLLAQARGDHAEALRRFEHVATANPGFLYDDWRSRAEIDPYSAFYYKTVFGYAGLTCHLAHAQAALDGRTWVVPPEVASGDVAPTAARATAADGPASSGTALGRRAST